VGLLGLLGGIPRSHKHTPARADDWDRAELQLAEREVRDRSSQARPDDEETGDDWGPGTVRR
jgi:hypothetical protein